jgi:DNA-binding CsgD family transcriptional regulator
VRQIPGLDPEVQAAAHLTDRQAECLDLHVRGASYRWIARELDIEHVTAREHTLKAIRRIERVMREDEWIRSRSHELAPRPSDAVTASSIVRPANRLHDVESRQQPHGEARTMAGRGQRG